MLYVDYKRISEGIQGKTPFQAHRMDCLELIKEHSAPWIQPISIQVVAAFPFFLVEGLSMTGGIK